MRKLLLVILLMLICKASSFASHIVGGEFELVHLQDNTYRLNLIIYFDEIWGEPGAKYEPTPVAWIYRKSDNAVMRQVRLPFLSEGLVQYTVPACADDNTVKTTKQIFSQTMTLNPEDYDDPEGYYIVWQRCCRNYNIVNVISENPDTGGIGAGQTFYLEIPPLIKDGERFINTSPQLFPPLSDYACINRGYYADFKGFDADGDSLVYSLTEPLNTPSAVPHPQPPSTAPYPFTRWENTYSLNNIVHGNPDLTISNEGLLRVTPTEEGIFVFAVKCEEYRDGEKIGEVRRDFQMVVIDCPAPGNQPAVQIELADGSIYKEGDVLNFATDDTKCVQFTVEDPNGGEVHLKLDPVGYEDDNFTIDILGTSPAGDRLDAEVCFSDCPPTRDLPFEVNFIGLDMTCPQPMQDTVRLTVAISPPENDLPAFKHKEDDGSGYSIARERSVTVNEASGGMKFVELLGEDADGDFLTFTIEPIDFSLAEFGMAIVEKRNVAGIMETWLQWNYDCQQINFDTRSQFEILITLEDEDDCLYEDPLLLTLNLNVNLPDNSEPEIFSKDLGTSQDNYIRKKYLLREVISFDVSGIDEDGDFAVIEAYPANFQFSSFDISYSGASGAGNSEPTQISSTFTWPLTCSQFTLAEQDSFRVNFVIEDFDKCQITNKDTLTVDFILSEPQNNVPELTISSLNNIPVVNDSIHVTIGEAIKLRLTGTDAEGDFIYLNLMNEQSEKLDYSFANAKGEGMVTADFNWMPECADLSGQSEAHFPLTLRVQDDHCILPMFYETTIYLHVRDIADGDETFLPPNLFTPNKDEFNPYFGMYRKNPDTGAEESILPVDNCEGQFEEIVIYNRWGNEVFTSFNRDFKWYGTDAASGVYFYYIRYSNHEYRGSVTLKY